MNVGPHPDVHAQNMAATHAYPPASTPMHYSGYQPSSILQSGPHQYSSGAPPYSYQYGGMSAGPAPGHPVSSSMSNGLGPPMGPSLPLPTMSAPGATAVSNYPQSAPHTFDSTGQIAPPGMKPRVTATLWEDEGSLCFQVEAKGVCVARREDNHMINGTKLLNVAGMTRGRRDGILKSEKTRHVVKIGPMHLKGVWIPFDRALDFANKEKITELLYPLFVHDIGALLYHPTNQPRPGGVQNALAAVDRRRDARYIGAPPTSGAPSLHHHHSLSGSSITAPPAASHAIPAQPTPDRPGIGRAHTFPTPPASASSIMMENPANQYNTWNQQNVSVPTTPASTPPSGGMNGMHYATSQAYDASRQGYPAAPMPQPGYGSQPVRFGGPLQQPYPKSEMAPPPRAGEGEHDDGHDDHSAHPAGPDGDHEHNPNRATYAYNPNAGSVEHVNGEDMKSSPHQNGSGRVTPRSATSATWPAASYGTPQRPQQASSTLYNVMDPHGQHSANSSYYPTPYNGETPNNKRGREDDDVDENLKRQKTGMEASEGGPVGGAYNAQRRPVAAPRGRAR